MTGSGEQSVTKPEAAPASTLPALPELPTMPQGTGGGSEMGYSPLSMLALVGLGIAIAYAVTVLVGGLMAFSAGGPLLLPTWSFLVPTMALILCLFARYRIKVSEGTLSGLALTLWGISVSLVFGLGYTANYYATYLAVTNQAQARANEWLQQMKEPNLDVAAEKAFWLTLPPTDRTEKREDLEVLHNSPGGPNATTGPFTNFQGSDFLRLMSLGGSATQTEFKGVDDWGYENGSFLVKLRYDVKTPQASFTLLVGVQGLISRNRDKAGRQWSISLAPTVTHIDKDIVFTDAGEEMIKKGDSATRWARGLAQATRGGWGPVYFNTVPPAEAARQMHAADTLIFLQEKETWLPFLRGMSAYQKGGLIRDDAPVFWAVESQKAAIVTAVKAPFDFTKSGNRYPIEVRPVRIPDIRVENGVTRVRVDIPMKVEQGPNLPPFAVDARLILRETTDPKQQWYVEAIELVRGRTPPQGRGG